MNDNDKNNQAMEIKFPLNLYDIAHQITPGQFAYLLEKMANNMLFNPQVYGVEVANFVLSTHRTLQGTVINFLLAILARIGAGTTYTDARNEVAVSHCRKIHEIIEKEGFQPYI